jgi:hypothetical protein
MYVLKVLNPVAKMIGEVQAKPLAPRPSSLDGKTVGLKWSGTAGGDIVLRRVQEVLEKKLPTTKFVFYSGSIPAPKPMMERIKKEVDAVIAATAD